MKELPVVAIEPYKHGALPRMREAWYHRQLMGHTATQFILKRYRHLYPSESYAAAPSLDALVTVKTG